MAILPLKYDDEQKTIHFKVGHASLMDLKKNPDFTIT